MPAGEMLSRMSGRELAEWEAYESINGPLGPARGDFHAAMICATLANIHRGKGKPRYRESDFLPEWDRDAEAERVKQTMEPATMADKLKALTRFFGGRIRKAGEE